MITVWKKKTAKELMKLQGERAITGFYGILTDNNSSGKNEMPEEREFASNAPN